MRNKSGRTLSKNEIPAFAKEVIELLKNQAETGATILALRGDLGAGKTTLVQAIGAQLGVAEHITSPTFTIMKQYGTTDDTFGTLVHMDAYRIEELAELGPLRFETLCAEPKTLICIEWPEKIQEALPNTVLTLALEIADEEARIVHLSCG